MKKIISYPLTLIFYVLMGVCFVLFHFVQVIAYYLFGYKTHKKSVDVLNFFLLNIMWVLGNTIKLKNKVPFVPNKPHIIVSNHQSMYDVTAMGWYFRKLHPKYVSKMELGNNIPSVSFNLKHGGSVLINRKDARQSLSAIKSFAQNIQKNNWAAVIFPEGTRSRNGQPKRFSKNGLKTLLKYAPDAVIIPVTINHSWNMAQNGGFPLPVGHTIEVTPHDPIEAKALPFDELFENVEETIKNSVSL